MTAWTKWLVLSFMFLVLIVNGLLYGEQYWLNLLQKSDDSTVDFVRFDHNDEPSPPAKVSLFPVVGDNCPMTGWTKTMSIST